MNGVFPSDFKVTVKCAKIVKVEPASDISCFGPLSLCFENRPFSLTSPHVMYLFYIVY